MKTILITGNSGYIGSHLSARLQSKYRVLGLDLAEPKVDVYTHIPVDVRILKNLGVKVDTVIHLAALVKVNESVLNPLSYYSTNFNGTTNLLNVVGQHCTNFIFASTGSAEYCNNPYGISKRAAEDAVKQLCNIFNLNYTIFRFYNVIGSSGYPPTNPDGLFYNLLRAKNTGEFTIFGNDYNSIDGTAIRDYVHVEEICSAIETAIEQPANTLENLGHGKGHTVKEIAELFQKVNQCNFNIKYGPRRHGDLEKSVLEEPSNYLPNMFDIKDLVKIPKSMLV